MSTATNIRGAARFQGVAPGVATPGLLARSVLAPHVLDEAADSLVQHNTKRHEGLHASAWVDWIPKSVVEQQRRAAADVAAAQRRAITNPYGMHVVLLTGVGVMDLLSRADSSKHLIFCNQLDCNFSAKLRDVVYDHQVEAHGFEPRVQKTFETSAALQAWLLPLLRSAEQEHGWVKIKEDRRRTVYCCHLDGPSRKSELPPLQRSRHSYKRGKHFCFAAVCIRKPSKHHTSFLVSYRPQHAHVDRAPHVARLPNGLRECLERMMRIGMSDNDIIIALDRHTFVNETIRQRARFVSVEQVRYAINRLFLLSIMTFVFRWPTCDGCNAKRFNGACALTAMISQLFFKWNKGGGMMVSQ